MTSLLPRGIIRESALHLRTGFEESHSESKERTILQDTARSHGGRPLHEPDSYLRTQRRELVPVLNRTAAARGRREAHARGLDAVELWRR